MFNPQQPRQYLNPHLRKADLMEAFPTHHCCNTTAPTQAVTTLLPISPKICTACLNSSHCSHGTGDDAQGEAGHPALCWGHWQTWGDALNLFPNTSMERALQTSCLFCSSPTWCFIIRNSCTKPPPKTHSCLGIHLLLLLIAHLKSQATVERIMTE